MNLEFCTLHVCPVFFQRLGWGHISLSSLLQSGFNIQKLRWFPWTPRSLWKHMCPQASFTYSWPPSHVPILKQQGAGPLPHQWAPANMSWKIQKIHATQSWLLFLYYSKDLKEKLHKCWNKFSMYSKEENEMANLLVNLNYNSNSAVFYLVV